MAGPPPKDPNARRRRNPTPGFKLLPHEGRKGPVPPWPLMAHNREEMRALEEKKWADLWLLPQAVEWERMRCFDDVALYVRVFVEASLPGVDATVVGQLRQLDSKIGVSPQAMRALRWETDEPDDAEVVEESEPAVVAPIRRLVVGQ